MPPKADKKRKSVGDDVEYRWLLTYTGGRGGVDINEYALFSTKSKAISGLSGFMDAHTLLGEEWKYGLKGFGKEDKANRYGFKFFEKVGNEGVLLMNDEGDEEPEAVYLRRMHVDQDMDL
jgi:hypothetical protein